MSDTERTPATIAAAMGAIAPVAKAGKNTHQGYSFQRAPDLYAAVRSQLAELGIDLRSVRITHSEIRSATSRKGEPLVHAILNMTITFTNRDGAVISEVDSVGEAMDSSDKAFRKAMTFGLKAALVMAFLIPDDSIEDGDAKSPKLGHPGGRQPKPKNQASPAARALATKMAAVKERGPLQGLVVEMAMFTDSGDRKWLSRCYAKRLEQLTGEVIDWRTVLPRNTEEREHLRQTEFPVGAEK